MPKDWSAIWCDPDTFTTTLLAMFLDTYGTEGLSWSPDTIVLEIEERWNIPLPRANFDKLMVGINMLTTNQFFVSLPTFIDWCNIINGDFYDPELWNPADVAEIAWAITESLIIDPPDESEQDPFSTEILAYIGAALDAEGIMNPPDILRIGLRGNDPGAKVQTEFSDDPEMFSAIYKIEAGKTDDINAWIKHNLRLLSQQIESLQLRLGDGSKVVQLFQQALA